MNTSINQYDVLNKNLTITDPFRIIGFFHTIDFTYHFLI
jgi:hypothetical protein